MSSGKSQSMDRANHNLWAKTGPDLVWTRLFPKKQTVNNLAKCVSVSSCSNVCSKTRRDLHSENNFDDSLEHLHAWSLICRLNIFIKMETRNGLPNKEVSRAVITNYLADSTHCITT